MIVTVNPTVYERTVDEITVLVPHIEIYARLLGSHLERGASPRRDYITRYPYGGIHGYDVVHASRKILINASRPIRRLEIRTEYLVVHFEIVSPVAITQR